MPVRALTLALLALGYAADLGRAAPVTGWQRDTSFGGGATVALIDAGTDSPLLGNGTANNADNTAIYAAIPPISLAKGEQITLTGSAEMVGTSPTGDFRWGLFKDDGVAPDYAGWLGYIASAESTVWSKDPSGTNFATTTFASVAAGRGAVLGQMAEPNGVLFDPGTYEFRMTVERFDNQADVRIAVTNEAIGFSIATPSFVESEPSRLTLDFDRVGFLAGSALNADQVRFSGVDVSVSLIEAPTLQVHSSGLVFITNQVGNTFDLTHYEVTSESGVLDPLAWMSLDDQENNDPLGVGWEEAGGSTSSVLAEVNLLGTTPLESGGSLRLGAAYTPGGVQDLAFHFTADGKVQRGLVEYVQTGDYNGDGHVDAADYSVWRDSLGQTVAFGTAADGDGDGVIGQGDYEAWKNNFGAGPIMAAGLTTTAPEPRSIALLCIVLVVAMRGATRLPSICAPLSFQHARPVRVFCRTAAFLWLLVAWNPHWAAGTEINQVAGDLVTFNTNGAWSWYMDERVIVDPVGGKLLMSSAADVSGTDGAARNGDIDVVAYDLSSGQTDRFVLSPGLGADDHNAAALLVRQDGRYLAVYTRHNADKLTRYRVSTNPHDATSWEPEQTFNWGVTPSSDFNVTYSNLFYLPAEDRTYNFARANNRSPNMMLSDDDGSTWDYGGRLVFNPQFEGYVNGYFKYASNGVDRIDFIATEHHPRDFNNSIYHGYIQGGQMFRSDGTLADADIFDNSAPNQTSLTPVFLSDPENGSQVDTRAWTTDLHVDSDGNPYGIFTTRANDIPVNTNGYNDHRFWYARFDGNQWDVHQLAKAGARLYPSEQDYTGLVALDPHDPDRLFISTTIDPRDETFLGMHEIFEGVTADGGATWSWTPITFNSQQDNLRPIVPIWDDEHTALVWLRGTYSSQLNYDLDVVGLLEFGPLEGRVIGDLDGNGSVELDDFAIYIAAMHTDLSGLTPDQAWAKGDLNGDFLNDGYDFQIFRQAYDEANGAGAFDALLTAVPEPAAAILVGIVVATLAFCRRREFVDWRRNGTSGTGTRRRSKADFPAAG